VAASGNHSDSAWWQRKNKPSKEAIVQRLMRQSWGRKQKILVAMVVLVTASALGVVALNNWANTPDSRSVRVMAVDDAQQKAPDFTDIHTPYFSTVVQTSWETHASIDEAQKTRYHLVAHAPAGGHGNLAITSDILPADGLSGVADYHLRVSQTADYSSFNDDSFPKGTKAFTHSADSSECALFMAQTGRYVSVVVSREMSFEDSLLLLKQVLTHWEWARK